MFMYRNLYLNTQPDAVDWLFNETLRALARIDRKFRAGAVGFSFMDTVYLAFGDNPTGAPGFRGAAGHQVSLRLFAYGDDRTASHGNMNRLMQNLRRALEVANYRIGLGEIERLLK
jgi:hypothetical protein